MINSTYVPNWAIPNVTTPFRMYVEQRDIYSFLDELDQLVDDSRW